MNLSHAELFAFVDDRWETCLVYTKYIAQFFINYPGYCPGNFVDTMNPIFSLINEIAPIMRSEQFRNAGIDLLRIIGQEIETFCANLAHICHYLHGKSENMIPLVFF